ncbi:hypothetical protein [Plebeiibacterium marinum]|uniref:Uncharacterized protein n=1 Tax=Plebeiibacterium marinum TaxID=2992111 RepID=A0AAE3SJT3_9BACT|nr:hypothetical protein [Plebeiobacterium marinum]MCW3805763.1 hypothetical protein [Plebeiobacterium marinum]
MLEIKLSFEKWLIQITEMCIDWFMNLFADPEYYWVAETYPGKKMQTVNTSCEQKTSDKKKGMLDYEIFVVNKVFNSLISNISNGIYYTTDRVRNAVKGLNKVEFSRVLKFLHPLLLQGMV